MAWETWNYYWNDTKGSGELEKVIFGEVKDTKNTDYAVTGLAWAYGLNAIGERQDGRYLKELTEDIVEGRVFIGDINVNDTLNEYMKIHTLPNRKEQTLNITCL